MPKIAKYSATMSSSASLKVEDSAASSAPLKVEDVKLETVSEETAVESWTDMDDEDTSTAAPTDAKTSIQHLKHVPQKDRPRGIMRRSKGASCAQRATRDQISSPNPLSFLSSLMTLRPRGIVAAPTIAGTIKVNFGEGQKTPYLNIRWGREGIDMGSVVHEHRFQLRYFGSEFKWFNNNAPLVDEKKLNSVAAIMNEFTVLASALAHNHRQYVLAQALAADRSGGSVKHATEHDKMVPSK